MIVKTRKVYAIESGVFMNAGKKETFSGKSA
jgi:hypothetical protein